MPIQYFGTNAKATVQGLIPQAAIADIDTGTVDGTYGAPEAGVLGDLQTKVQTLIDELVAVGILESA